jgi:hypothetical protein
MTPDERSLLTQFLNDLIQTKGVAKDPEAASMIEDAVRINPDGAYVLVQHSLLADQALHQAQAKIAQLQAQLQPAPPQPSPSFLGGAGLGPTAAQTQSAWGQSANPPTQGQPLFGGGQSSGGLGGIFGGGGGGLGTFLRSAGTTAAGVAGGEMLFSGLSNLFGGRHGGGFGGGFGGGLGGEPVENVTINEYGDDGGYDGAGYNDDYN